MLFKNKNQGKSWILNHVIIWNKEPINRFKPSKYIVLYSYVYIERD